jgi:hypothetical protein
MAIFWLTGNSNVHKANPIYNITQLSIVEDPDVKNPIDTSGNFVDTIEIVITPTDTIGVEVTPTDTIVDPNTNPPCTTSITNPIEPLENPD